MDHIPDERKGLSEKERQKERKKERKKMNEKTS